MVAEGTRPAPVHRASARRIETALGEAFRIGVALSGTGAREPEELVRFADVAMYRAKARGGARHHVFAPTPPRAEGDLRPRDAGLSEGWEFRGPRPTE